MVIFCGTTYQLFKHVIYPRLQRDYFIVRNNSSHTLNKMTVSFGCGSPASVVFTNVAAGSETWKSGNRDWGSCDSSRLAKAEGKLSNGQHVGPKQEYSSNSEIYFLSGDRFTITVNKDGSLIVPSD